MNNEMKLLESLSNKANKHNILLDTVDNKVFKLHCKIDMLENKMRTLTTLVVCQFLMFIILILASASK